jgi:hypothetical protein
MATADPEAARSRTQAASGHRSLGFATICQNLTFPPYSTPLPRIAVENMKTVKTLYLYGFY